MKYKKIVLCLSMVIASISIFGVIGSAFADPCPCSQVKNDLLVTAADIPDATYKNPAELLPAPQIFFDSNLAGDGGANLVGGNQAPQTVDDMLNGIESEFKLYKKALEREDFDGALLLKDSINLKFSILHAQNIDCSKFEDDIALLGDERVWKLEMERWEKQHSQKTDKPEDEGCSSCPSKTNQNIPEEPPEFTDEELERIAQEHSLIISEAPEQRTTNRDIREYSEEIEHRLGKFDLPKPQISQAALDSFVEYVLEDPIVDSVIIVNNEGFNIFISRESIIENFGEDKLAEFEAKRGDYPGYVYQKAKGPGFMEHIQLDPEFIEERTRLADEHFYINRDPATEVLELRTDDARHFRNPDGSMTAVYRAARPSTRGPMEPMDTQIYSGPPYANSYDYASNSGLFSCWYSHAVYWSSYNMGASAYYEYGYGGYYYWNCAIGPETDQCYEFYRSSWEWYLSGIPIYSNITSTYINMYVLSYNMAEFNTSNLYVSLYNMARRFGVEGMNASQHWTDCGDGNRYIYSLYLYTGQGYTGDQNLGATCNSDVSVRVNGDRTFGIGARYYTTESSADRGVLVDGDFVYLTVNYNPPSPDGCDCVSDGRVYNTYIGYLGTNYWWEHTGSLLGPSTCRWYRIYLYAGREYNFTTVRGVSPNSNADFDTYLELYNESTCSYVIGNDDQWAYPPGHSFLSHCPTSSGWHLLKVRGWGSSYGNYTLGVASFTLYGAPTSVTVSPSSICLGGSVSITSNGGYGGGNYITYGSPGTCGTFIGWNYISSWTPPSTGTYTIWTERRNGGYYYGQSCLFGSNMGSGGAKSTTLTVVAQPTPPTSATRTPTDATVCVGALLQITGASGGNAGVGCVFQYRFLRGGIVVQDWSTSNNSYLTTSADAGSTIYAQLRRSNCQMGTGCNESAGSGNLAQWNVVNDPTISISGGTTVCWGSTATLSSSVSGGTGTFYYQWQYWNGSSWQNISGATGSTYAANPSTYGASTQYRCILTCSGNGCDGATSNIQTVNLYNNGVAQGQWIGGVSTDWNNCQNWGSGRVPDNTVAVTIPSGCTYYPVLTSTLGVGTSSYTYKCASLTINSGGSVTIGNNGVYLYGTLTVNGGTFTQNSSSSSLFNIYNGGRLQVNSGTCTIGDNTSYGYSDIYVNSGGTVAVAGGTLIIDDILRFESGATYTQSSGITYVKYRGYGSAEHGLNVKAGSSFTMTGGSLYICGGYSLSTSYCGLYFDPSSTVSVNTSSFIRFIDGTGYNSNFYVNFGGKTVGYIYNEKSTNAVYTCGDVSCYQLRAYQGSFYVRNSVYASSYVYTYNAGRIYVDSGIGNLDASTFSLNGSGGLYVSAGLCTCRGYFYKYSGTYAQFSGGTTNVYYIYYNYGTGGNTTVNGGTLNVGTAAWSSSYYFRNQNGILNVTSGTLNAGYYLYNIDSYTSNQMNISGGYVECGYIPNYEGRIDHTGGTITTTGGYYREYDAGGGNYYGSGSAVLNLNGSGYVGLKRAGSYFNHVNVNGTYDFESSTTQNWDVNGSLTINGSFNSTYADIYLAGNWTNNGTFTHANRLVTMDGGSATITTGGSGAGKRFYNLNITGGTKTQNGDMGIDNDINITGTLSQGANAIYVTRNWNSASGSVTSVSTSSNTYCNGSVSGTITSGGNYHFGYLQISKSSASYGMTLIGNVRCTHLINNTGFYDINSRTQTNDGVYYGHANSQLRMSTGIMYVNGTSTGFTYPSFYMASGATENITGGNIYISGYGNSYRAMMVNGSFAPSGGTVHFTGGTSVGIAGTGTLNFYNLRIAKTSTAVVNLERSFNVIGEYDASATTASDGTSGGVVPGGYEINF